MPAHNPKALYTAGCVQAGVSREVSQQLETCQRLFDQLSPSEQQQMVKHMLRTLASL